MEEPGIGYRQDVPSDQIKQLIENENDFKLIADGKVAVVSDCEGVPVKNLLLWSGGIEPVLESEAQVC